MNRGRDISTIRRSLPLLIILVIGLASFYMTALGSEGQATGISHAPRDYQDSAPMEAPPDYQDRAPISIAWPNATETKAEGNKSIEVPRPAEENVTGAPRDYQDRAPSLSIEKPNATDVNAEGNNSIEVTGPAEEKPTEKTAGPRDYQDRAPNVPGFSVWASLMMLLTGSLIYGKLNRDGKR